MFPWELVFFGVGFLFIILAFDYGLREIQRDRLMDDIEQYLTWVEAEEKEDDGNGY